MSSNSKLLDRASLMRNSGPIITITLHAAVDVIVDIASLHSADLLRAKESYLLATGKGINVARACHMLSSNVEAIVIVGPDTSSLFEVLPWTTHVLPSSNPGARTRVNVTIHEPGRTLHIRSQGPSVEMSDISRVLEEVQAAAPQPSVVVVSGSVPAGSSREGLATLLKHLAGGNHFVVVDSSELLLSEAVAAKVDLIKPNLGELADYVGYALTSDTVIAKAAKSLVSAGVKSVVVSLGERGALVATERGDSYRIDAPVSSEVLSDVGAGDAMVAGIVVYLSAGRSLRDAVAFGVACGTASVSTFTPGSFDTSLAERLVSQTSCRPY